MSLIICVKSCYKHMERGDHNVIRSTWGIEAKQQGIEVRFFIGKSKAAKTEPDEITVDCEDDYMSLPFKTREICRWARGKNVDHIFLCDTDTFLEPRKFQTIGYSKIDYAGKFNKTPGRQFAYDALRPDGQSEWHADCYSWCSGGVGYFLSKKALMEVAYDYPSSWAEDVWVGQVVGPMIKENIFKAAHIPEGTVGWHFPRENFLDEPYDPKYGWMEKMYQEQP